MPERCPRIDQTQALLYHARSATLFCSEKGEACASIPTGVDSRRVLALRSPSFRDWLTANFYGEYEAAPSASAFRAVLNALEAQARFGDFPAQKVDQRLGFEGDPFTPARIFLDLANAEGEVLEISSQGWRVADNLLRPFQQSATSLPLPRPDQGGGSLPAWESFAQLFRLSAAAGIRALTWLLTALRPIAPYPVLVLRGPAGSGKSVLARALRALIDPSAAPLHRLPARDREILQLAEDNWVLVFDQVRRIHSKISDTLCAVSSGDAVEIACSGQGHSPFPVARPMILIAPQDETRPGWIPPRALSNRTMVIDLPHVTAGRPEAALWPEFEALRPAVLATLADALVTALRRVREISLGKPVRFPDCVIWAVAAAPALAMDQPAIVDTFADSSSMWNGSDPLRDSVHALLDHSNPWSGSATELLKLLRNTVSAAALPATPKGLSQALARMPGVLLGRNRDARGERILTLAKTFDASEKTPAAAGTLILTDL